MADNDILIASQSGGVPVALKDRGGVRFPLSLEAPAVSASVLVAAITTSSASPAFASDTSTRRQMSILNTGTTTVEISPVASFAFGAGFPLGPGASHTMNYSGAVYARTGTGAGELRAWSEA